MKRFHKYLKSLIPRYCILIFCPEEKHLHLPDKEASVFIKAVTYADDDEKDLGPPSHPLRHRVVILITWIRLRKRLWNLVSSEDTGEILHRVSRSGAGQPPSNRVVIQGISRWCYREAKGRGPYLTWISASESVRRNRVFPGIVSCSRPSLNPGAPRQR
jgi:hypothetical protein